MGKIQITLYIHDHTLGKVQIISMTVLWLYTGTYILKNAYNVHKNKTY